MVRRALALGACLLCLGPALWGRDKLKGPALLVGNPGITLDFILDPAEDPGRTRVEALLGGRFSDFSLPPKALRAPRLDAVMQFNLEDGSDSSPAQSERIDLAQIYRAVETAEPRTAWRNFTCRRGRCCSTIVTTTRPSSGPR